MVFEIIDFELKIDMKFDKFLEGYRINSENSSFVGQKIF